MMTHRLPKKAKPRATTGRLTFALLLCLAACASAIFLGPKALSPSEVLAALFQHDPQREADQVLLLVRLPRVLLGVLVGGGLATAGALMQALTRNPLAGPELTGFGGGASLAVLAGMLLLPGIGLLGAMGLSFVGGLVGMALVFSLCAAAPGGATPTRLALAGLVVSTTFAAITGALVNYFQLGFELLYWTMGGLNATLWPQVVWVGTVMAAGFGVAIWLIPHLDALRLGQDLATGLGVSTVLVQRLSLVAATLLAGPAVAAAGPVAFVGLMCPHVARALVGGSYLKVIPLSAGLGAAAVALADTLARCYGKGYVPLGVYLSGLGSVLFLVLVTRRRGAVHHV